MELTQEKLKEFQDNLEKSFVESLEKKLPEVVDQAFEKKFDSQIVDQVNAALKAAGLDKDFPGFGGAKSSANPKESALKFFKAVFGKDKDALKEMGSEFKTMTEGTDSAGGFLVPEEVMAEVDRVADNYGLIRKLARTIPMGRDVLNMPVLGTKPIVFWPGEAGAATKSQAVIRNVKLEARTVVGLTPISNELMADANIGIVEMLTELIAEQITGAEDEQGFNGTGAPFTGVLQSTEVSVSIAANNTLAAVLLKDLSDAQANIKSSVLSGCVWVFHRTVWNQLKNIQEGSQTVSAFNTVPVASMKTEGGDLVPAGMLWGYPVYLSDKMPSNPVATEAYGIFGNFKKFYLGNRQQLAITVSSEATIAGISMFETNSQAVRVLERVALAVGVGEAFNVLKLAA